jgi:hypothetical protein
LTEGVCGLLLRPNADGRLSHPLMSVDAIRHNMHMQFLDVPSESAVFATPPAEPKGAPEEKVHGSSSRSINRFERRDFCPRF